MRGSSILSDEKNQTRGSVTTGSSMYLRTRRYDLKLHDGVGQLSKQEWLKGVKPVKRPRLLFP